MNKYQFADKKLSALLGWRDVTPPLRPKSYLHADPNGRMKKSAPQWTQDAETTLRLMAEHNVWPSGDETWIHVHGKEYWDSLHAEKVSDHPDKETAIRYALVQAVIFKLEAVPEKQAAAARCNTPSIG